jgi:hypothetical protein
VYRGRAKVYSPVTCLHDPVLYLEVNGRVPLARGISDLRFL